MEYLIRITIISLCLTRKIVIIWKSIRMWAQRWGEYKFLLYLSLSLFRSLWIYLVCSAFYMHTWERIGADTNRDWCAANWSPAENSFLSKLHGYTNRTCHFNCYKYDCTEVENNGLQCHWNKWTGWFLRHAQANSISFYVFCMLTKSVSNALELSLHTLLFIQFKQLPVLC